MHISSLSIGSDLLVSLEDNFYQRLLRYTTQKILLCQMRATSCTWNIKKSLLKYKIKAVATFSFFLQYNWFQLDKRKNNWKMFYKGITKKETRKNITSTYLTALSNRTVKNVRRGWTLEEKNWIYIFKAEERKQYQNNGTENLFIVIMYLIEPFKMRLLSMAESSESPKKSKSTFKWLGKFLKDILMLDMSMKRGLRAF